MAGHAAATQTKAVQYRQMAERQVDVLSMLEDAASAPAPGAHPASL